MTEDEALAKMNEFATELDREAAHVDADEIVSVALRILGWDRLADAYDKARENWWYA